MSQIDVRKSDYQWKISRKEFKQRFEQNFYDPLFDQSREKIAELEEIAWKAYSEGRKSPRTNKAGVEFKNPDYDLSDEWRNTRDEIQAAQKAHEDQSLNPRILIINASHRNDKTCPGEISKSYRLMQIAEEALKEEGIDVETLNLSELTSEYQKVIYPCKGCVSTAMPLCHWPCSCYPNHSLGQTHDWMSEIYPKWVRAHGILFITPVYWHQAPSSLKLMIDRLVCADGGNPDPTTTDGKDPEKAKALELKGWDYPRHLEGRVYSVVVHGDTTGANELKNALTEWLNEMMLIPSGVSGQIARYIGYYGTYAESHEALDKDQAIQSEVSVAARSLALNVRAERMKKLESQLPHFHDPRPK